MKHKQQTPKSMKARGKKSLGRKFQVKFRATEEQYKHIMRAADCISTSYAEWIRTLVLADATRIIREHEMKSSHLPR